MIVVGIDPHKRSHAAVAIESASGELHAERTVASDREGREQLLAWARARAQERLWALEDCRHVSRRLERFLLEAGEQVVRVPPRLMAGARRGGRRRGKSDPIDALAVARVALREPSLPSASLEAAERELKLLVDHRQALVDGRTRVQSRLRWLLHELELGLEVPARALDRPLWVERLARRVRAESPALLELPGCGVLTAAKLLAEIGGVERFASDAKLAMHAGVAPLDASSGEQRRHRLNRGGNRQLNLALHRVALTQARLHEPARAFLARKRAEGKSAREALRCLKRHLVRIVYRLLLRQARTVSRPEAAMA